MYIRFVGGRMKEKIHSVALISVGILSSAILIFGFMEYILPVVAPFLIAFLLASLTYSPAQRLSARLHTPQRGTRLMLSLLFALSFAALVILIAWQVISAIWGFLVDIGNEKDLTNLISRFFSEKSYILGGAFPSDLADRIGGAIDSLFSSALSAITSAVTGIAGGIPRLFLFLLVTLVSLAYFSFDYDRITKFLHSVLPRRAMEIISLLCTSVVRVIGRYILSYSLIMLITYFVLLVGFSIIRIDHGPILALLVAFLDILPIIGVGTVLLPWGVYELAVGISSRGIGLILLFVANSLIRQIAEPRIVGKSLDIHPIVSLIMLYVGYALFGFTGMIVLPVAAVSLSAVLKADNSTEIS